MHVSILLQPNFILLQLGRLMNLPREKIRKYCMRILEPLIFVELNNVAGGNN